MPDWTVFHQAAAAYAYDPAALQQHWARLHQGDVEPFPSDPAVQAAWALFHAGRFQQAWQAGLKAGAAGITVANKAQAVFATYVEQGEKARLKLLQEVAERALAQQATDPGNPNAYYWQAYAWGRYSQFFSVSKALAMGLGTKVKLGLESTLKRAPLHTDAQCALGTFHAEVIDKVGKLLGLTQGADVASGLKMYELVLKSQPSSPLVMIEVALGLRMLAGEAGEARATALEAAAAACTPMDASEWLGVEFAKERLKDATPSG